MPLSPDDELAAMSAVDAAAAMRRGDLSAEDYAGALLRRCRRLARLHAFLHVDEAGVLEAARAADRRRAAGTALGALHGLPLAIKDNIDTAGLATTCNAPMLAANVAKEDAEIVARLRRAGAFVLGKTNLHEFAMGAANDPALGGDAVNPYAPDHATGGSSSGTAVAVAARLAPLGLGTDTGGSVRIPAAHCGIAGLRPTLGRYPAGGMVSFCPTRDTAGPMARSVADLALLDAAITGALLPPRRTLAGLRLGVPRRYFHDLLAPETAAMVEREHARLRAHGAVLVDVAVEDVESLNAAVSFVVFGHEARRLFAERAARWMPGATAEQILAAIASPGCRRSVAGLLAPRTEAEAAAAAAAYAAAISTGRPALREAYRRCFTENDVAALVLPTTALPAPSIDAGDSIVLNGRAHDAFLLFLRIVDPTSNAGLPGVTVPAGLTASGVPLGLAFDGPEGSDRDLLAIAAAYEAIRPPLPPPALPEG